MVIQQKNTAQKSKALTKEEVKDMLQYGVNYLFNADNAGKKNEGVDDILARGENKTNALNRAVEESMKVQQDQNNLPDFTMNSINIFEFMQQDEKRKREDAEALDEMMAKEMQAEYRTTRREKNKPNYSLDPKINKREPKADKKITVPEHQFFLNKDILQELLQKEEEFNNAKEGQAEPLNMEEQMLKEELMETGFTSWSRQDFTNFVTGCEKHGRKSHDLIAELVSKPIDEITRYASVFW